MGIKLCYTEVLCKNLVTSHLLEKKKQKQKTRRHSVDGSMCGIKPHFSYFLCNFVHIISDDIPQGRDEASYHRALQPPSIKTQNHGVVICGEDTYRKKVVFHLSELKPEAEMVSEASRDRYDFDKPENITDLFGNPIGQIEIKIVSSGVIGNH